MARRQTQSSQRHVAQHRASCPMHKLCRVGWEHWWLLGKGLGIGQQVGSSVLCIIVILGFIFLCLFILFFFITVIFQSVVVVVVIIKLLSQTTGFTFFFFLILLPFPLGEVRELRKLLHST